MKYASKDYTRHGRGRPRQRVNALANGNEFFDLRNVFDNYPTTLMKKEHLAFVSMGEQKLLVYLNIGTGPDRNTMKISAISNLPINGRNLGDRRIDGMTRPGGYWDGIRLFQHGGNFQRIDIMVQSQNRDLLWKYLGW